MTTPPTHPPHLACYLCHPPDEHFSFWSLTRHYYGQHPLVMRPDLCKCGHGHSAHVPNKRAYCDAADPTPCTCANYERSAAA